VRAVGVVRVIGVMGCEPHGRFFREQWE